MDARRSARCETGPSHALHIVQAQHFAPLWHEGSDDAPLVSFATQNHGRLVADGLVAPLHQTRERDIEVAPFWRESVFESLGVLSVSNPPEDTFLDQPIQPVRQNVAGDTEALLELQTGAVRQRRRAQSAGST